MNAQQVFIDESGFLMSPLVRRTWAPCGKTPLLYQRTRSHEKISVIAALTIPPKRKRVGLYFSLHYTNITSKLVIRFLRNLSRQMPGKPIVLVWDRLLAHRSKIVLKYLDRNKRIHAFHLPPYAPELNPVEHLWGYMKCKPMANFSAHDRQELAYVTRYNASKIKRRNELLRSFLYATPLFLRPR